MEELLAYIRKFGQINVEEEALIKALFVKMSIHKGEYWAESGKVCRSIAFVGTGVFRSLYYDKTGNDFTRYFIYEGRFIGDLFSFQERSPSVDYIEAVTDAAVWAISSDNFLILESKIAFWPLLMTKLYAFVAESKLKVANVMMNLEAKERYRLFLNYYPGLANRVPMAMLASYLGITASSLSRIRKAK